MGSFNEKRCKKVVPNKQPLEKVVTKLQPLETTTFFKG